MISPHAPIDLALGRPFTALPPGRGVEVNTALFNSDVLAALVTHAKWYLKKFGATEPGWYVFPFGAPQPTDPTRPRRAPRRAPW